MERTFISGLMAMTLLFASCAKETVSTPVNEPEPNEQSTYVVSYDEAVQTLQSVLDEIDSPATRGSAGTRKIANHYTVGQPIGSSVTRSVDGELPDPYVHIFNFEDGEGYALISGDKRTAPVFAITESGALTKDTKVDNPGLILFLANMEAYYFSSIENYEEEPMTRASSWSEYGPWINSAPYATKGLSFNNWSQGSPYNDSLRLINNERPWAGCTATATALVMAFHKHSKKFNGHEFNWDVLTRHERTHGVNGVVDRTYYNSAAAPGIALLMQQLGLSCNLNMSYGLDGSGADEANIPRTLRNYGYSNGGTHGNYNETTVLNELKAGYIVVACGFASETKNKFLGITLWKTHKDGHTWVLDRIMARNRTKTDYVDGRRKSTSTETQYLLRCNWGWGGTDNGYFFSKGFNADEPAVVGPNGPTRSDSPMNFQYDLDAVTGIRK
jgi:hypothetical protein